MRSRFSTTLPRSLTAVASAFGICAFLFLAIVVVIAGLEAGFHANDIEWIVHQISGSMFLVIGIVGGVLSVIGVPLWLPLHFSGARHWAFALLLGALLFFVGWFGPHTDWLSMPLRGYEFDHYYSWSDAARDSSVAALVGALIAGLMWRIAYRRDTN